MTRTRKIALALAAAPLAIGGALACGGGGGDAAKDAPPSFAPTLAAEPATTAPAAATTTKAAPAQPVKPPTPTIEDGVWIVAEDVPAGVYKVANIVGSDCYWEISKISGDIVDNDLPGGGRPKVTLRKGQQFTTHDCGTWMKVG